VISSGDAAIDERNKIIHYKRRTLLALCLNPKARDQEHSGEFSFELTQRIVESLDYLVVRYLLVSAPLKERSGESALVLSRRVKGDKKSVR
jgi:hypothetical protein